MPTKTIQNFTLRGAWGLMTLMAAYLFFITIEYFSFETDINFLLAKRTFIKDVAWMTAFYIHISSSMLCLITGPFQFIAYFRKKSIKTHRLLGKIYIASILFAAAPSGFYMAIFANGGIWAQVGFAILSVLWVITTFKAYLAIKQKNIQAHKAWMVRSYALTFSAVTLRTWVPILSLVFMVDRDLTVILTAWINWIPNILITELILKFFPKSV